MGKTYSVMHTPKKQQKIEEAITSGTPIREVANKFRADIGALIKLQHKLQYNSPVTTSAETIGTPVVNEPIIKHDASYIYYEPQDETEAPAEEEPQVVRKSQRPAVEMLDSINGWDTLFEALSEDMSNEEVIELFGWKRTNTLYRLFYRTDVIRKYYHWCREHDKEYISVFKINCKGKDAENRILEKLAKTDETKRNSHIRYVAFEDGSFEKDGMLSNHAILQLVVKSDADKLLCVEALQNIASAIKEEANHVEIEELEKEISELTKMRQEALNKLQQIRKK